MQSNFMELLKFSLHEVLHEVLSRLLQLISLQWHMIGWMDMESKNVLHLTMAGVEIGANVRGLKAAKLMAALTTCCLSRLQCTPSLRIAGDSFEILVPAFSGFLLFIEFL